MAEKQKKLKKTLVQTRKIIANKFRKLHSQRIERERKLEEKFAPISDSLNKLIDVKHVLKNNYDQNILPNNAQWDNPVNNIVFAHDRNLIEHDRNLNEHNQNQIEHDRNLIEHNQNLIEHDRNLIDPAMIDEHDVSDRSNHVENTRNNIKKEKKEEEEGKTDAPGAIKTKKFRKNKDIYKFKNKKIKPRDSDRLENMQNNIAEEMPDAPEPIRMKRSRTNNSTDNTTKKPKPPDSDAESDVVIRKDPRTKHLKKKTQLHVLHNLRVSGLAKFNAKHAPKRKAPKIKVTLSPDDFDEDGNFLGANKPKRRKIQTFKSKYRQSSRLAAIKAKQQLGKGLNNEFIPYTENIVYEYFDDPNELCERLKLLLSSKQAGNSNHNQEINSILEELRELNLIE